MSDKRMKGLVIACITPMNPDGSINEEDVASFAEFLVKTGADGIGIMTPAFFPMDDESMFRYYSDIITLLPKDFPVYIYNIPGCTTNDVSPILLNRLLNAFPNIKGIKFSKPDLMRAQDYLEKSDRRPDVLIVCDSLFLQCLTIGGVGTVTGPGGVFHERFTRLYRQFNAGDIQGAMETQRQIVKTDRQLEGIPPFSALKTLLKMRGAIKCDKCREPLRSLTKDEVSKLDKILNEYYKEENL